MLTLYQAPLQVVRAQEEESLGTSDSLPLVERQKYSVYSFSTQERKARHVVKHKAVGKVVRKVHFSANCCEPVKLVTDNTSQNICPVFDARNTICVHAEIHDWQDCAIQYWFADQNGWQNKLKNMLKSDKNCRIQTLVAKVRNNIVSTFFSVHFSTVNKNTIEALLCVAQRRQLLAKYTIKCFFF